MLNSLLLTLFLLSVLSMTASGIGSRSILRSLGGPPDSFPDVAADLNNTNFDSVIRDSTARFAIVEFFAHWCPACRNYKPHYEKVARLFNGPVAAHPGVLFMARVDCASKINTKLCDRYSVSHYPMLFWGHPAKFASGVGESTFDKTELRIIDDFRTAERLLNWINKKLGSGYSLDDNEHGLNISDPEQITHAVSDVEEATSSAFEIILEQKMINLGTRVPLIRFLQLLVAHHPSKRCRKGSAEILTNFDDLWPSDLLSVDVHDTVKSDGKHMLQNFKICGKEIPRGYWIFCRGSKNDTRGFSCGLWVLFHSLSVRIGDQESQVVFTTICEFIQNFFICEECRQHFHSMCSSVSIPFNTTERFALWLWNAHNEVNKRLMKEEETMGTGDPKFPKMTWPTKQLCPSCFHTPSRDTNDTISVDWNMDEVFKFLVGYYGKKLVSTYKDNIFVDDDIRKSLADDILTTRNVVTVPVGAALGIALASCAFGALACFWRSQQKNRKYFHAHSLKNI